MKTLLLTAYNSAMAPIGDLTAPLMEAYARQHGFEFFCSRVIDEGQHYWQKIWWAMRFLESRMVHRVIWLDCDQVITNPDFVPPWYTGFQASFDWGSDAVDESQFSACGFVIGADASELMKDTSELYGEYCHKDFPEQSAMRHLYREGGDYRFRMRTHPRRVFNAVPREISEEAPEPWQKGDWCAHLTHVDVGRRAELFHVIREQSQN